MTESSIIEVMLGLFWIGFTGLNLWLWRAKVLDEPATAHALHHDIEGESSCSTP